MQQRTRQDSNLRSEARERESPGFRLASLCLRHKKQAAEKTDTGRDEGKLQVNVSISAQEWGVRDQKGGNVCFVRATQSRLRDPQISPGHGSGISN
jgi:hypothetical protein